MNKQTIVSVRLPEADLNALQVVAQVEGKSVGEIIRSAVRAEVERLARKEGFSEKFDELRRRQEEAVNQLVGSAFGLPSGPSSVKGRSRG